MRACIPTNGNAGAADTVSDHFGSAPYFTLYDSESGDISILENRNAHNSHGSCHPMAKLAGNKIDAVICGGMGRRAIEALNNDGIRIFIAETRNVNELIEQIKSDSLTEIDPAQACRGHGHAGGCGHGSFSDLDSKCTSGLNSEPGRGGRLNGRSGRVSGRSGKDH